MHLKKCAALLGAIYCNFGHSFRLSKSLSMSASTLTCDKPLNFETSLNQATSLSVSRSVPLFVLFYGEKLEATGKSWCPDCVAAEPVIDEALSKLRDYVMLECPVVREEYRKSDYAYRVHPTVNLRCVPTLFRWGPDGPVASLNDSQSQNLELVGALVTQL